MSRRPYQLARKERGVAQRCGLIRMGNSNSSSGPSAGSRAGSVLEHVEHARRTGVCALQGRELSLFPERVKELKENLRTLDISQNKLVAIPSWIEDFHRLKSLSLANNRLARLPEELGYLKKLETLNLSFNLIPTIPDSLVNLKMLKTVNLSHNKLKEFPLFLCQLIHVDFVDLSANQITSVHNGIDVISAVEINLNQNQITVLPESLARCKRLKVLRVEENCIAAGGLPPAILRDSTISLLCLEGNVVSMRELKDLPDYETYMERYSASRRKQE